LVTHVGHGQMKTIVRSKVFEVIVEGQFVLDIVTVRMEFVRPAANVT
jgi:hypothetical protein